MSDTPNAPIAPESVVLVSLEIPPAGREVETGELVCVAVVQASNVIRDVREMITNALGGRMRRYETLLELTLQRGFDRFREELAGRGYHGALGVRLAHPEVVAGGAELIIYGTGFKFIDRAP